MNQETYLEVSQENGKALYMRHIEDEVIMLKAKVALQDLALLALTVN